MRNATQPDIGSGCFLLLERNDMFDITKKEMMWGDRKLTLETGRMARQADGAVLVTYGGTSVLCTVCASKNSNSSSDFFPLTVNYAERYSAAGRFPGGFIKREGRPTEKEALVSRLIDRPIRPLFDGNFKNETQIICTVLSFDKENDSAIPAMIGASAALTISGVPFEGPIAAAKIGYKDGQYFLNPKQDEIETCELELVLAGTSEGVLMVESEANELSDATMLGALSFGHKEIQGVISLINDLAKDARKKAWPTPETPKEVTDLKKKIADNFASEIKNAYSVQLKQDRHEVIDDIKARAKALCFGEETVHETFFATAFKKVEYEIVRNQLLTENKRIDGRATNEIRPITSEVSLFPSLHGSAMFTRGETQALAVTTLGTGEDAQLVDGMDGESKSRFMLFYNFPPFSVGETGRMGTPGRREIGHGKLAWRAINPLLPSKEEFPYVMKVMVDILSCNGSSSMATVCSASQALMDAGVPMKRAVAGIAMGLISSDNKEVVLSDIIADEDFLGDMDFKVTGTTKGITALQMDIKLTRLSLDTMAKALKQGTEGLKHILDRMSDGIGESRESISETAPQMRVIKIDKEKIGELIGPGGKNIRDICETTGAKIDIGQDGTVQVFCVDQASLNAALNRIDAVAGVPEIGAMYVGEVVSVKDFGAFVQYLPGKDGFLHISQIAEERVENINEFIRLGDKVRVKLVELDDRGRVRLSMKNIPQLDVVGEDS